MISTVISRLVMYVQLSFIDYFANTNNDINFSVVFGTLYPAYASYKAVKTKNIREYVSPPTCPESN